MNTTPAHSGLPQTYYFSNSVQPIAVLHAYKENKHNEARNRKKFSSLNLRESLSAG